MKTVRDDGSVLGRAAIDWINAARLDALKIVAKQIPHVSPTALVTLPEAEDEDTLVALANGLKATFNDHVENVIDPTTAEGAHFAADTARKVAAADATDTASAITLLNELKAKFNVHREVNVHIADDTVNSIAGADATDEETAIALANEALAKLNAHFAAATSLEAIRILPP